MVFRCVPKKYDWIIIVQLIGHSTHTCIVPFDESLLKLGIWSLHSKRNIDLFDTTYWMHHHSPKKLVHPRHMGNRFRNYWESATPKKVYEERSDFVVLRKNIGNIIGESSIVWAWLLESCLWHGFWYRYFVGHHMPTCHLHCTKSYE